MRPDVCRSHDPSVAAAAIDARVVGARYLAWSSAIGAADASFADARLVGLEAQAYVRAYSVALSNNLSFVGDLRQVQSSLDLHSVSPTLCPISA